MNFLDSAIDWLQGAMESAGDTVQGWSTEWDNAITNFKNKARNFVNEYNNLKAKENIAAKDEKTKQEYDALMKKGGYIFETIKTLADKLDFAIGRLMGNDSQTLNGMGVLPLIPIAVIVGAIAAMTAWLSDAYIMNKKLDTIERLSSSGTNAVDLADALNEGGGLVSIKGAPFSTLLPWFLGGLAVYYFWPQIKKAVMK